VTQDHQILSSAEIRLLKGGLTAKNIAIKPIRAIIRTSARIKSLKWVFIFNGEAEYYAFKG
jgi:hypothetical protein